MSVEMYRDFCKHIGTEYHGHWIDYIKKRFLLKMIIDDSLITLDIIHPHEPEISTTAYGGVLIINVLREELVQSKDRFIKKHINMVKVKNYGNEPQTTQRLHKKKTKKSD